MSSLSSAPLLLANIRMESVKRPVRRGPRSKGELVGGSRQPLYIGASEFTPGTGAALLVTRDLPSRLSGPVDPQKELRRPHFVDEQQTGLTGNREFLFLGLFQPEQMLTVHLPLPAE